MQTTLARSAASSSAALRPAVRAGNVAALPRRSARSSIAAPRASLDTNFFVNAVESAVAISIPVAVSIVTAEKSDDEFVRTKSVEGLIPIGVAVAADAIAHSIPGEDLSFLFFLSRVLLSPLCFNLA